MFKQLAAVVALGAAGAPGAHAAGVDLALGNDTADLVFLTNAEAIGYGGADLGFGVFFNDDDDVMATAKFLATNVVETQRSLQLGVGAKAFVTDLDSGRDASAIGPGGQVRYLLPTALTTALTFEGYYAPDITSFGDADGFWDVGLRFELEVSPSARAFVGYRWIEADVDGGPDEELADELQFGVRILF